VRGRDRRAFDLGTRAGLNQAGIQATLVRMNMRLALSAVFSLLLSACGNRSDLMLPAQSPPEDAGRYLIKPKPAADADAPAQSSDDDDL